MPSSSFEKWVWNPYSLTSYSVRSERAGDASPGFGRQNKALLALRTGLLGPDVLKLKEEGWDPKRNPGVPACPAGGEAESSSPWPGKICSGKRESRKPSSGKMSWWYCLENDGLKARQAAVLCLVLAQAVSSDFSWLQYQCCDFQPPIETLLGCNKEQP